MSQSASIMSIVSSVIFTTFNLIAVLIFLLAVESGCSILASSASNKMQCPTSHSAFEFYYWVVEDSTLTSAPQKTDFTVLLMDPY